MKTKIIVLLFVLIIIIAGVFSINPYEKESKSEDGSNGVTIIIDGVEKEVTEDDLRYILNEKIPNLIEKINRLTESQNQNIY